MVCQNLFNLNIKWDKEVLEHDSQLARHFSHFASVTAPFCHKKFTFGNMVTFNIISLAVAIPMNLLMMLGEEL